MGGKSGGGQSAPYEAPNTLSSAQLLRVVDLICEGPIRGFANGQDAPFKSVYLNDTPIQNSDGSYNFSGVAGFFQRGLPDQAYVPGFDVSERTVAVSVQVKKTAPAVRTVSDPLVGGLRVTLGIERNARTEDNGDVRPSHTVMRIELRGASDTVWRQVEFTEKASGVYYEDVVFDRVPTAPFNIRVTRETVDSTSDRVSDKTYFASYVEVIDARLSYPYTAFAALGIDSEQFGGSEPRRNYLILGREISVPSNYNPETRTYTGVWDGSFKTAWTNNPAWILYDVLTQPRFSTIARRLKPELIDKWMLYQIAKYCDELVPDGFGGREPRFVCNAYIADMRQADELIETLCSVFCALPVWNGSAFSAAADTDADPAALYNNSNVVDGEFSYSGAAFKAIHTAVHVQYMDKDDSYRLKTEYVADHAAIERYGLNIKQVTAFGCDSRGQAVRFGAWVLQTELRQTDTVSFAVGREGLRHLPYDIIQVMDNDYAGAELSGRLKAVSGDTVTLDREVETKPGAILRWEVDGKVKSAKVAHILKKDTLVLDAVPDAAAGGVWVLADRVKPRLYRAVEIRENAEEGTYQITALLHDPAKYAAVDKWASFERETHTLYGDKPVLLNPELDAGGGAVGLSWGALATAGSVLGYDIKIYKDGRLFRHIPDAQTAALQLENLPQGDYRAEIRAKNAKGAVSEPVIKAWSLNYNIDALTTEPRLLGINLSWSLPQTVAADVHTEIWYGKTDNREAATRLAALPYPQNSYALTGVGIHEQFYFWVRIVDAAGNTGEFTPPVLGRPDTDPTRVSAMLQGAITADSLDRSVLDLFVTTATDAATAATQGLKTEVAAAQSVANAAAGKANTAKSTADTANTAANAAKADAGRALTAARDAEELAGTAKLRVQSVDDRMKGMYGIKLMRMVDGKEVVAGWLSGIDGKTGSSNFTVAADKFQVLAPNGGEPKQVFSVANGKTFINGDLIADGAILGRHIAAHQTLTAPVINGGRLNIGNFSVNTDGSFSAVSTSQNLAGVSISNRQIVIRDERGNVRVVVGYLKGF